MWWDGNGGWGVGAWLGMSVMMLTFWGLLVALVIWAVRSARREQSPVVLSRPPTGGLPVGAEAVLAERFACGEIDETEYARRRAVLRDEPDPRG